MPSSQTQIRSTFFLSRVDLAYTRVYNINTAIKLQKQRKACKKQMCFYFVGKCSLIRFFSCSFCKSDFFLILVYIKIYHHSFISHFHFLLSLIIMQYLFSCSCCCSATTAVVHLLSQVQVCATMLKNFHAFLLLLHQQKKITVSTNCLHTLLLLLSLFATTAFFLLLYNLLCSLTGKNEARRKK